MSTSKRTGLGNGSLSSAISQVTFYHPDQVGTNSVTTTTTATSQSVSRTYLDPFGDKHAGTGSDPRHLFTDQERDAETGLDYFGARYYDAWVGRFLEQDPELLNGGAAFSGIARESQYLATYTYALNRPTTMIDPTGRLPWWAGCGGGAPVTTGYTLNGRPIDAERANSIQAQQLWGSLFAAAANAVANKAAASITVSSNSNTGNTAAGSSNAATAPEPKAGPQAEAIESNPADKRSVMGAVHQSYGIVGMNPGSPRGSALTRDSDGRLSASPPESRTLLRGEVFNTSGFAGGWKAAKDAVAIAGSWLSHARSDDVLGQQARFNAVSGWLGGVPVYVLAPHDNQILVFESGYEPRILEKSRPK